MSDDIKVLQLYNEGEQQVLNFYEYRRLHVRGQSYALLQPEDDMDQLIPFRVEYVAGEDENEEVYIYVVDDAELEAVEAAWQRLHS